MREIEVVKYETIDGEVFDDEEEALKHENEICNVTIYDEDGAKLPLESIESAILVNIPDEKSLKQFDELSYQAGCSANGIVKPGKYIWRTDQYILIDDLIENYKNLIVKFTELKEEL